MTTTANRPARGATPAPAPRRQLLVPVRNAWRSLVSMRTALVLLFLLAVASVPGALLPQRSLNAQKVDTYLADHPVIGPWMDRVGLFEVFASPWFAAVYVLLFVSLIGCLLPRTWDHLRHLRAAPVPAPSNLARLPHHAQLRTPLTPAEAADAAESRLARWRTVRRSADDQITISAERGHLREWGNLVFHFSLIGLLIGIAAGKLYGYEGQVIAIADGGPASQVCNTTTASYDSFRAGLREDGTGLVPFCVRVDSFSADYLPSGQAKSFDAPISYQSGADLASGTWRPYDLRVNRPLRLDGDRVYLLGHGFAPTFTVTYPDGETRTQTLQFRPVDATTLLSEGTLRFDPPAGTYAKESDPARARSRNQIAVTGLFAPTAQLDGTLLTSASPKLTDPEVAVDVLRGNAGLDSGRPQSIFTLDPQLEASGALVRQARQNLKPGQSVTLSDGTRVRFDSVTQWVSLQTSHDPGQFAVLVFAVTMTAGLLASLVVKRRRVWVRLRPAEPGAPGGATVAEVGGLARTDQAGWGEEFTELAADLVPTTETEKRA